VFQNNKQKEQATIKLLKIVANKDESENSINFKNDEKAVLSQKQGSL